jgi:hypothetical protein
VVSHGVGIAHQVEPVHRHALAEVRRSEQPVHQLFVRIRIGIVDKRVHLFRRGRQAGQVKAQPPDQRHAIRGGRHRQALPLQTGENETIHRAICRRIVRQRGRLSSLRRKV